MEENVLQINGGITINVGKDYIWNPNTCNCKNGKYLARITGDSTIMSDET